MSDNKDLKEIDENVEGTIPDDEGYERYCFLCHRPESVTGKLIDLPNNMSVCSDCMNKSFEAMNHPQFDLSKLMNTPGVQFLNVSDLDSIFPKQQRVKKKKSGEMETGLFFCFFSKCIEKTVDICRPNVLTSEETNFLHRNHSSLVP